MFLVGNRLLLIQFWLCSNKLSVMRLVLIEATSQINCTGNVFSIILLIQFWLCSNKLSVMRLLTNMMFLLTFLHRACVQWKTQPINSTLGNTFLRAPHIAF